LLRDARRAPLGGAAGLGAALHTPQPGKGERVIFDDGHQWQLSTNPIRGEDDPPTKLRNANLAYDGLGSTREFYRKQLGRDSLDNAGLTLQGHVNFGTDFNNAFWDGTEMVFGNGDGQIFKDFTGDVDVIGHELTSDIFGVCVEQFSENLDAGTFNWLIGEDVMADGLYGEAIRSMAHPGTAYDNPLMGKDPQAADMSQYVPGGDPHVNSGIVNRVFYLVATDLGTFPAAKLWYATLQNLWPTADFAAAADVCAQMARILARDGVIGRQGAQTVRAAFHEVGII
jgi:Zn-dependent metalloprotease